MPTHNSAVPATTQGILKLQTNGDVARGFVIHWTAKGNAAFCDFVVPMADKYGIDFWCRVQGAFRDDVERFVHKQGGVFITDAEVAAYLSSKRKPVSA